VTERVNVEGGLRTGAEQQVGPRLREAFSRSPDPIEKRLEAFPKYVRQQNVTKFLAQYEIFRRVMSVKGSIVECGVFRGASLMTWAHLCTVLEPINFMRRIYGFDTFAGFPSVAKEDHQAGSDHVKPGDLFSDSYQELLELSAIHDSNRPLGHVPKIQLVRGDVAETIPKFLDENRHVLVSLLFLDMDLYEPTRVALRHFLPRMPRGAVVAFDELDNRLWPGETQAVLDELGLGTLKIERVPFDPYIGFAVLGT